MHARSLVHATGTDQTSNEKLENPNDATYPQGISQIERGHGCRVVNPISQS
jgi:hypothetical protein